MNTSSAAQESSVPPKHALAVSLVEDVEGVISPPDVCLKVLELVESQNTSAQELGEVILRDPNLTARVLKLANSSFYNLAAQVDTVSRAITILGIRELYGIVVAVSAIKSFSRIPNGVVNMDTFWRHSIMCGLVARNCASHLCYLHPERLFIGGLLHDIGSLVAYSRLPELYRDLLQVANGDEEVFCRLETDELGFSHATLGALMLEKWQLPGLLAESVAYHHQPAQATGAVREAAIIHLANVVANRSVLGGFSETPDAEQAADPDVRRLIGENAETLDEQQLAGEAGLQFPDAVAVLAPGSVSASVN